MNNVLIITLLLVGFLLWYVYYSLELFLNGANDPFDNSLKSKLFMYFRCLKEDFIFAIPIIGNNAKGEYIKKMIGRFSQPGNSPSGWIDEYSYEEIIRNNLYVKVGKKVLPGLNHFLFTHIFIPLFPFLTYCSIFYVYSLFSTK